MTRPDFGTQLRIFRQQSHDPKTGKIISQQKFGELLGQKMGDYGVSGAAVSDWERNKSSINVNDRLVLINVVKILKECGGIKTLADANLLLETGNYRALNEAERNDVFPDETHEGSSPRSSNQETLNINFLTGNILFNSQKEFQQILDEAKEGPPPAWPRIAVSLINNLTGQWNIFKTTQAFIWLWAWIVSYLLVGPSLQWSKISFQSMVMYASGTLILPAMIGAMVNTKDREFWQEQKISNSLPIRLYVHQGAYIGFHLGYFLLLPLSLMEKQFDLHATAWVEFVKMLVPVLVGYASAQLVPYNLWRAYKRLHLKDGAIFFVFIFLGPAWMWFVLEFNNYIGIFTLLIAASLLSGAMAIQYRRKGTTVIPIPWLIIFYGFILICQIVSLLIQ